MFNQIRAKLGPIVDEGTEMQEAIEIVRNIVYQDQALLDSVIDEAVEIASRYTVRTAVHDRRRQICRAAGSASTTKKLQDKATELLNFRLPGGGCLKDATGHECIEAARFYRSLADTNYRRSQWLTAVGKKAGPNVVGQKLSEKQIHNLYKKSGEQ